MLAQAIAVPDAPQSDDPLSILNAVAVAPAQLTAALETLSLLPQGAQRDPRAQAFALQAYAGEAGLGDDPTLSAALHARVTALAKWTAAHDPGRQSDPEAVIAASSQFRLSALATGIGFEPAGFQEMILFIEELPW
jgi:hypothetical protein